MTVLLLTCPSWPLVLAHPPPALAGLASHAVPERPGREDLAPLLTDAHRVIVAGTDADLAAVALRLLRTERLADVELAYLPTDPASVVARVWALPTDPVAAASLAVRGEPDPVPLVRDDVGGVLLGHGELRPMRGVVYCDDQLVLRGQANRLTVTPSLSSALSPAGVAVRAARVGVLGLRSASAAGRAVQVGCVSAVVSSDGVPHPRPVTRWTWYRHTEPLRLVRGLPTPSFS